MTISSLSNKKNQLRSTLRQLLRDGPLDSGPVCEAARRWLAARPALRTVALYAALADEVDLLPLVVWDPSRRWVFPRICGEDLIFHELHDVAGHLARGACGVREPSPTLPRVPIPEIDAFLCPGLAFDLNGARLGRGRGYYDRALASARPDAVKVGICHPIQRVADTFRESHDVAMDVVIEG
ncbi:MAG: 5-formyltetrahydrofolate cyclo-ligase [Verrucomicrobia bacterium]|nr:MAG: 5-formyltetrahydrofolate cyclo-ligase [Verrucomicrobiota bacterium]